MGAVRMLAEEKRPFVAGPTSTSSTAPRWPDGEPRRHALGDAGGNVGRGRTGRDPQAARPAGMETEVFAYGRLPLAFSARCFTARHFNLQKDDCQFKCIEFPDGLLIRASRRNSSP
jgi:hypothetical protein